MRQEVYELLAKMDQYDLSRRMAFQCAPVIAGLKVSNLLTVSSSDDGLVYEMVAGTGLSGRKLGQDRERSVFLIYRKEELTRWINDQANQMLLAETGLDGCSVDRVLDIVQIRYLSYVNAAGSYPHEIGVLLGYPPEDVKGFVVNKGRNFLASGYWKVYGNLSEARKRFFEFDRAREQIVELVAGGTELQAVIRRYAIGLPEPSAA